MFWVLLRLIAEYKEIATIINQFVKSVPELEKLLKIVSQISHPTAGVQKALIQEIRKLKPESIKKIEQYISKLGQNANFHKLFQKKIKDIYGDALNSTIFNLANIKINLGSSWLAYGMWIPEYQMPNSKSVYGVLEWATKNGYGPYTTPNISEATWKAMVLSLNHAGTVGWERGVFNARRLSSVINRRFEVQKKRIKKYGRLD